MFANREEAAQQLAHVLAPHRADHPLVLAIPRGAVPMARTIAEALAGELDVVLVHKLGAPGQPEYAIGAVDESGHVDLRESGIDPEYVHVEAERQLAMLRDRRVRYSAELPPPILEDAP